MNDDQKKNLLFDDHNYESYIVSSASDIDGFVQAACGDNRQSDVSPKIVGEWSLTFGNEGDSFTPMSDHASSYSKWFSAQQRQYEALDGWVFWTWKTDEGLVNVEQWNYQSKPSCPERSYQIHMIANHYTTEAVEAGIINKDLGAQYDQNPC